MLALTALNKMYHCTNILFKHLTSFQNSEYLHLHFCCYFVKKEQYLIEQYSIHIFYKIIFFKYRTWEIKSTETIK